MTVQDRTEDCKAFDLLPGDVLPMVGTHVARVVSIERRERVVDVLVSQDGKETLVVFLHDEVLEVIA